MSRQSILKTAVIVLMLLIAGCSKPWEVNGLSGVTSFTDAHSSVLITEEETTYPWTTRSKWLFGFAAGMHYLDFGTSCRLHFEDRNSGFYEANSWLLGDHPDPEDLALFKAGTVAVTWLVGEMWPEHRDVTFFCSGLSAGIAAGMNDRLYRRHR